jgi:hypothetical protein
MPDTIFARSSIGRKKEFKIITTIERQGDKLRFVKRAAYTEGEDFLLSLPEKTSAMAEATKDIKSLSVPSANQKGNTVWFELVSGPTLDQEFSEALFKRNGDKLAELFGEVLGLIDKLDSSRGKIDPQAKNLFGDFAGDSEAELLDCGYIDFNLDNFIRKANGFYLLDAEFKYSFGVPKQFIINRLVVSYLARYSHLIGTMTSKEFPIIAVGENLFIPKAIWDVHGNRFKDLQLAEKAENKFQMYHNYSKGINLRIKAEDEWQTLTQSAFLDVSQQLANLRSALGSQLERYEVTTRELQQTKTDLDKYRNHWLLRRLLGLKKALDKLKRL